MTIPPELIRRVASRMLEEMYFCDGTWVGPGLLDLPFDGEPAIGARVTFSGAVAGEFRVAASAQLAARLAADFLAAEVSDITGEQSISLVLEFANVVCGATLGEWMPEAAFNYSVPSSLTADEVRQQWPQRFLLSEDQPELGVNLVVYAPTRN
jgi:hypothetical protein